MKIAAKTQYMCENDCIMSVIGCNCIVNTTSYYVIKITTQHYYQYWQHVNNNNCTWSNVVTVLYSFLRKLSFPGSSKGDSYALMSASHILRTLVQHKLVMLGLQADRVQKWLVTCSSSHDTSKMRVHLSLPEHYESRGGIDPAVNLSGV